jgi:hypothetical protein
MERIPKLSVFENGRSGVLNAFFDGDGRFSRSKRTMAQRILSESSATSTRSLAISYFQ